MTDMTKPPLEQPGGGEAMPETDGMRSQRMQIIEAFSAIIKEKRKNAIEARKASGIEKTWAEDDAHYDGEDESVKAKVIKGMTTSDGLREVNREQPTRSTVFLKITRPYVDAAAARVSDMLLPTDDRNFALKATPKPELTAMLKDMSPAPGEVAPQQPVAQPPQAPVGLMAKIKGAFSPGQGVPPAAKPTQQKTVADIASEAIAKAKKSAELAQEEIDDWLVECRYHAEVRRVIESAAKVGTGILNGPHPTLMRNRAAKTVVGPDGKESWTVEMQEKIAPASKWINHWNFYPDGACGDDIQKGSHVFECDDITFRKLTELLADQSYIAEQIQQCLDEGPCEAETGTRKLKEGQKAGDKDLFQIWYFHGMVSRKDMEAAGCKCDGKELYPALVTMVNDRVIKITLSPLDSGEFPYDVMVWQARTDHWAGVGVARQMRECQKGANAAVRNLMDNAGLAAGPQLIIDRSLIEPANGRWEVTPRKIWWPKKDEENVDVTKAFTIVQLPDMQGPLLNLVQFWTGKAEEVTGLPMLLQGQMGQNNPTDKVGIAQIQNNNGSTVLRRIARTFDDRITEPHIGRYYEWLLLYGPDAAKGDFQIDARGSSALIERDQQAQQLVQLIGLALNPAYGLDPELVVQEFMKSLRLPVKNLELSDEKKAEIASREPPKDPRIVAAEIMAKSRGDDTVARVQAKKMELDHDSKEASLDRALDMKLAEIDARLAVETLSSEERRALEEQKVLLAKTTLQLRTQTELSLGSHAIDMAKHRTPQVATPAVEPIGRAEDGKAYQQ